MLGVTPASRRPRPLFSTPRVLVQALAAFGAIAFSLPFAAQAKPIAFAEAWTVMHERDRNAIMTEIFYAPEYWWSIGAVTSLMQTDDKKKQMDSKFIQANLLVKRWNLPHAQGNLFVSYGLGTTDTEKTYSAAEPGHPGHPGVGGSTLVSFTDKFTENTQRYVVQGDYETRQFYTSFKVDVQQTQQFFDRLDTFQIGVSPYPHDYEDLAVWFVAQAKQYRGMNRKVENGAFLRLFKKNVWVEIGMLERKKSTLMFMINY